MKAVAPGRGAGIAFGGALVALLALVAAASRTRLFHEGEPPLSAGAARLAADFSSYLFLALLVLGLAVIAWALWPREEAAFEVPRRATLRSLLAQLATSLAGAALAAAAILELRLHQQPGATPQVAAGAAAPPPSGLLGSSTAGGPAALDWTAVALVLATLAVAAGVLWRRGARRRRAAGERLALARALQEAVADTLDDLRLEPDPRRAVIQAYARFERVLGLQGVPRRPPEAPLEYLARAFDRMAIPRPATERLADLFEVARFSTHPVSGAMRDEAVACLLEVRRALAG